MMKTWDLTMIIGCNQACHCGTPDIAQMRFMSLRGERLVSRFRCRIAVAQDFEIDAEFDYDNVACSGRVEPGICLPVARPVQGVQSSSESSDVEDAVAMDG
mmetsp:Transcript_7917/g.17253  ORF Transcript_7917/g.17253 Transcript_7917/m.17253 type:complete len:101 (-) Transcript_7917:109-411(-)